MLKNSSKDAFAHSALPGWSNGSEGHRGAVLIVNVESASHIPSLAEPWFLLFNADCEFRIVMSAEDLQKAGLGEIGAKWK